MNFLKGIVSNVTSNIKHFPEYQSFIDSLDTIRKSEILMIDGFYKAYSENLVKYSNTQPSGVLDGLIATNEAGSQLRSVVKEAFEILSKLSSDMKSLSDQEAEMAKWRDVCKKAHDLAKKSAAAADKATLNLNKAKISGKPADVAKAESLSQAASRKATDDEKSANDQQTSLDQKEQPYKEKFLESYVSPINAALDVRIKEAQRLSALVPEFENAYEKFHEIETDEDIENYRLELSKYEEIVLE